MKFERCLIFINRNISRHFKLEITIQFFIQMNVKKLIDNAVEQWLAFCLCVPIYSMQWNKSLVTVKRLHKEPPDGGIVDLLITEYEFMA